MGTTIAVSADTHSWLARFKEEAGLRSMDEVLEALAKSGRHGIERLMARHRKAVLKACQEHGIETLTAFGSRAWGAPHARSDVDLVATFDRQVSLFEVMDAEEALTEAFGVRVDLHLWSTLKSRLAERVRAQGVPIVG